MLWQRYQRFARNRAGPNLADAIDVDEPSFVDPYIAQQNPLLAAELARLQAAANQGTTIINIQADTIAGTDNRTLAEEMTNLVDQGRTLIGGAGRTY